MNLYENAGIESRNFVSNCDVNSVKPMITVRVIDKGFTGMHHFTVVSKADHI